MKILRITAEGLPLFKEKLDLIFYSQQRVSEEQKISLHPLFSNIYLNTTTGFIGINASGKTSVLKLILLSLKLINNEPINHIETRDILGESKQVKLNIFFISQKNDAVFRLETNITSKKNNTEGVLYFIESETLWKKSIKEISTRKTMLDFAGREPFLVRSIQEEYLPDDVSIMIAINKREDEHIYIVDLLKYTNENVLSFSNKVYMDIISFLDPTIERLCFDEYNNKQLIHLKFVGKEEILLNNPLQLNNYLSSGTIKGIIAFSMVKDVLKNGGYLILDEIENHFNKEIVSTMIRLFMDRKVNKNGGSLFFSTHYPEILDEYERNDSIYITRNINGITASILSNILKRNDVKKSDAYQSGLLKGTTPSYEAYLQLKKSIITYLE